MFYVFAEGDQARQRRDQRAYPADIYPPQQRLIIVGELRQQNRRRNVADHLAGQHADKKGILF